MRTETKTFTYYSFEELTEEAKEKAIEDFRTTMEYFDDTDSQETLTAFCNLFPVSVDNYDTDYSVINGNYSIDNGIDNLTGIRLLKYIVNNYWNDLFKPKWYYVNGHSRYSKCQFDNSCVLTGFYMDDCILKPIYEFLLNPSAVCLEELLSDCLQAWLKALQIDIAYQLSEEAITEAILINEYEFTSDGKLL